MRGSWVIPMILGGTPSLASSPLDHLHLGSMFTHARETSPEQDPVDPELVKAHLQKAKCTKDRKKMQVSLAVSQQRRLGVGEGGG